MYLIHKISLRSYSFCQNLFQEFPQQLLLLIKKLPIAIIHHFGFLSVSLKKVKRKCRCFMNLTKNVNIITLIKDMQIILIFLNIAIKLVT